MNAPVAVRKETGLSTSVMNEAELMAVLESSLYPGAKPESIKLVMGYCKAAGLDPIQKPVHIVPMWDSKRGAMRDVIMPGIGSYRTQASRSGQYAGVTEPEYGPDVTQDIGGGPVTFPAWCKVTVKRLLANGTIAEFSATERWIENYAVKGGKEKSVAPNAMWFKRPYGQLAKCTEAQALRKAFPEFGAQPTNDEMEGKALEEVTGVTIDQATGEITGKQKPTIPPLSDAEFEKQAPRWKAAVESGKKDAAAIIAFVNAQNIAVLTDAQKAIINGWKKSEPVDSTAAKPAMSSGPAIDENDHPFD